jgi:hypothetical protein
MDMKASTGMNSRASKYEMVVIPAKKKNTASFRFQKNLFLPFNLLILPFNLRILIYTFLRMKNKVQRKGTTEAIQMQAPRQIHLSM